MTETRIRPYHPSDLEALYKINQAGVPGVGDETKNSLERWINLSTAFVAERADRTPTGFMTVIELGTLAYDSQNLRWFEHYASETGHDIVYVDRIAVAEDARGLGIGDKLYHAAFAAFSNRQLISCEINIAPPNPGSTRFHTRLGFTKVGERHFANGEKAVGYYVRALA